MGWGEPMTSAMVDFDPLASPALMFEQIARIEREVGHPIVTDITRQWLEEEVRRAS
jgi:hypothetical protein